MILVREFIANRANLPKMFFHGLWHNVLGEARPARLVCPYNSWEITEARRAFDESVSFLVVVFHGL